MNVLEAALFTVRGEGADERISLPATLARLLAGPEIDALPQVAADQHGYLWRFLVRCAARALRTADLDVDQAASHRVPELDTSLRDALLQHSSPGDWELFQSDHRLPGFLQPPTPGGGDPEAEKYKANTASILTAIIGTKEHERKSGTRRTLDAEAVVYALIEYQGGVIFGGRGNYESQLMGSRSGAGSGSPFVGARIAHSNVQTFRHDVSVILARWDEVRKDLSGDVWALWTVHWDGSTPLPAKKLDPAFIPLARMVRLREAVNGRFDTVWFRASDGSRVADHTGGGVLGDPFTPLVPSAEGPMKVRGTLKKGYDYKEVVRLLFPRSADEGMRSPSLDAALRSPPEGVELHVLLEGTAFEQGKTRGFHRRVVRLPRRGTRSGLLFQQPESIHVAHEIMLTRTGATKKALRAALSMALTGDPRSRDDDRKKMNVPLDRLEKLVDRRYLDFLFDAAAMEGEEDPTKTYCEWLFRIATEEVLPEALRSLPRSDGRRLERELVAEAYLRRRLRTDILERGEPVKEGAA